MMDCQCRQIPLGAWGFKYFPWSIGTSTISYHQLTVSLTWPKLLLGKSEECWIYLFIPSRSQYVA